MCDTAKGFRGPVLAAVLAALLVLPSIAAAQAEVGVVKVVTKPAGAMVFAAGRTYGPTPVLVELPVGTHAVTISYDGYAPVKRTVVLRGGDLVVMQVVLSATQPVSGTGIRVHRTDGQGADAGPGTVFIATSPAGLAVFMNGQMVPQPTPVAFDIRAGIYELTLEQGGNVVYRKTVFVRTGRTLELDLIVKRRRKIDDSDPWK